VSVVILGRLSGCHALRLVELLPGRSPSRGRQPIPEQIESVVHVPKICAIVPLLIPPLRLAAHSAHYPDGKSRDGQPKLTLHPLCLPELTLPEQEAAQESPGCSRVPRV